MNKHAPSIYCYLQKLAGFPYKQFDESLLHPTVSLSSCTGKGLNKTSCPLYQIFTTKLFLDGSTLENTEKAVRVSDSHQESTV